MNARGNFRITSGKGFHVRLPNGYVASVQFGGGNYCDNYDARIGDEPKHQSWGCDDAEMAFWDATGKWYHPKCLEANGDDVYPRLSPSDLLAALNEMAALPEVSA